MSFYKRYIFVYKANNDMLCYAVLKKNWMNIMKEFPEFYKIIKEKTLRHYFDHIYKPLMTLKNNEIKEYEMRNDY